MKKRLCLRGKNVGRAETVKEAHTGMKDVFLVYNKCCFYEIVILNYFMNFSRCDMVFCTLDGKPIRAETFRRLIQRKSMHICRI